MHHDDVIPNEVSVARNLLKRILAVVNNELRVERRHGFATTTGADREPFQGLNAIAERN